MTFDMRKTVVPKSDQMNADTLIGKTLTIKITSVTGTDSAEQPVSVHFDGDDGKPFKPCKSMRRVMIHVWGPDAKNYVGKSMTLYCDPKVKFGGMEVGGIRISHMSDITEAVTMALTATKANKKPFTVRPLTTPTAVPPASVSDYDRIAKKIKKALDDSMDSSDLEATWTVDYADDLATLLRDKPDYHARLKATYDERIKGFES